MYWVNQRLLSVCDIFDVGGVRPPPPHRETCASALKPTKLHTDIALAKR